MWLSPSKVINVASRRNAETVSHYGANPKTFREAKGLVSEKLGMLRFDFFNAR